MGCWNGTCGLSQMSITAGTRIKVVVIQNEGYMPEASGFCYIGEYAKPISFIIDGVYNDYGGITDIDENSKSAKLFLKYFREQLFERLIKVEPDNYYDREQFEDNPVDYSVLEIEDLLAVIERGRVSILSTYYNNDGNLEKSWVNIGIQMFQTSIYETVEKAIYTKNENKDLIEEMEELFGNTISEKIQKNIKIIEARIEKEKYPEKIKKLENIIKNLKITGNNTEYFDLGPRNAPKSWNIVKYLTNSDNMNSMAFHNYFRMLKEENNEDVIELGNMFTDMIRLIVIMTNLRKSWSSQSNKGSQQFNEEAYLGLSKGIKEAVYINRRYIEEYGGLCIKDFEKDGFIYKEDKEYEILKVSTTKDEIFIKDMGVITWDIFEEYFER